jgi:hypothetical protein
MTSEARELRALTMPCARAVRVILSMLLLGCVRQGMPPGDALAEGSTSMQASEVRTAQPDPGFSARIVARRSLLYAKGADPAEDRPAYVRAGSGIAWIGDRLAVIQDDAHFVALVDPETGMADAIALPADEKGRRLFDDTRGSKHLKMDLESCFARPDGDGLTLTVLGSGSTERRTRIARLRFASASAAPEVRVTEAGPLYRALSADRRFSGRELNVEGAVARGEELWLFQRGNAGVSAKRPAVNAIGRLSLGHFDRFLAGDPVPPPLTDVVQVDLGSERGVPYGFTDATSTPDGDLLFLASAEDSKSTVSDGAVLGTRIGIVDRAGAIRTGMLLDEQGAPSRQKAEAIALDPRDPTRAWLVIDVDDPTRPSELLEVRLTPR